MMERDPLTKRFKKKIPTSPAPAPAAPPAEALIVKTDEDAGKKPEPKPEPAPPAASSEKTSAAAKSKWWEPVICFLFLCLLCGCSSFRIEQEEVSTDGTRRHTVTRGYALFDSKSDMSKVRATTTDKSQIQSIGALSQEASSQVVRIVVEGAKLP